MNLQGLPPQWAREAAQRCGAPELAIPAPRSGQLPAGDCNHLTALRQGAASPLLMGACSHTTRLCRATAHRLGPLSGSCSGPTGGISVGVSQYGLALANDRSEPALDECRSLIPPVTESLSNAPTCSWDALIVFRISRTNQTPAPRKANWLRRFPSAYQLLCIQAVNSFMASPLDWDSLNLQLRTGGGNWHEVQEMGRRFSCPPARRLSRLRFCFRICHSRYGVGSFFRRRLSLPREI
jgi:hypothetical protein